MRCQRSASTCLSACLHLAARPADTSLLPSRPASNPPACTAVVHWPPLRLHLRRRLLLDESEAPPRRRVSSLMLGSCLRCLRCCGSTACAAVRDMSCSATCLACSISPRNSPQLCSYVWMIDHWCEKKKSWLGYPGDLNYCHDCERLATIQASCRHKLAVHMTAGQLQRSRNGSKWQADSALPSCFQFLPLQTMTTLPATPAATGAATAPLSTVTRPLGAMAEMVR